MIVGACILLPTFVININPRSLFFLTSCSVFYVVLPEDSNSVLACSCHLLTFPICILIFFRFYVFIWASLVAQMVKNLPATQEIRFDL